MRQGGQSTRWWRRRARSRWGCEAGGPAEARLVVAAGSACTGDYGRMIRELIDPDRLPGVWAAASAGAFEDDAGVEGECRFCLERFLDGTD